jgi:hypothetical protein
MSEMRTPANLPWYELDRMILVSIGTLGDVCTVYVVKRVEKMCKKRGASISDEDIFQRILQMRELGTVSLGGDYLEWRQFKSQIRQSLYG